MKTVYFIYIYIFFVHCIFSILIYLFSFVSCFRSTRDFLYFHGDVSIAGEGFQIFTYVRQLWSFNSKSSLACQTYFPFILWSSSKSSDLLRSVKHRGCHYRFLRCRSVAAGIRKSNLGTL